ncbi:hypothetical protein D0C16_10245 [Cellvibrio sp. KY-GH-1]|uniref:hypothetical protein n=1 Tax=Cellvibrio sp. KY-GH-1 TaxID=2303332 RepID=UPI001247EA4F|nr:hypothetical protein [Cellvibrio sp. KY-GH-1]QEY16327.1 hypothetical protein D0C16_10245 [Cellvibrio sp. KY-GH-1]
MVEIENGVDPLTGKPLGCFLNTEKVVPQLDFLTTLVDFSESSRAIIEGQHNLDKLALISVVKGDSRIVESFGSLIYLTPEDFISDTFFYKEKSRTAQKVLYHIRHRAYKSGVLVIVDNCNDINIRALERFKNYLNESGGLARSKSKLVLLSKKGARIRGGACHEEPLPVNSIGSAVFSFKPSKANATEVAQVISEFCQLYKDLTGDSISIEGVYSEFVGLEDKR